MKIDTKNSLILCKILHLILLKLTEKQPDDVLIKKLSLIKNKLNTELRFCKKHERMCCCVDTITVPICYTQKKRYESYQYTYHKFLKVYSRSSCILVQFSITKFPNRCRKPVIFGSTAFACGKTSLCTLV